MKFAKNIILLFLCAVYGVILCNGHLSPIEARLPLKGDKPALGSPWPLPQKWTKSPQRKTLDPKQFHINSNANFCDVILNAIKRYNDLIFIDPKGVKANALPVLSTVNIEIEKYHECGYPKHNDIENYEIDITTDSIGVIKSQTVWGALRGLETLSQLVYLDPETKGYMINNTRIEDWPRYTFRAVHMDTARHYQPMKIILANLDALAYNKFNVFHWHIVDDQSFPFESKKFPELTVKGPYTQRHVYTQRDIALVIDYARMRGIRVIPELGGPGHARGIGKAFPDLLTPCYGEGPNKPNTPKYPEYAASEWLNPIINETYTFMADLYREFQQVFKDEFIHLGMDEVYYACWESNPKIKEFMQKHNMTKINDIEQYYVTRILEDVKNIGYKYIVWQDPADNNVKLSKDTIVGVWKDKYLDPSMDLWQNYISHVAKEGYQIYLAACWYLNYIETPYPGKDWEKFYTCDPRHFNGTDAEKNLVIGGEACMWSEFADGTNLLSRLWPRASAAGERLWSNPNNTQDVDTARLRLDYHRCLMLRRGIPAAPILNGYCGDYEWFMGDANVTSGDRVRLH